MPSLLVLECVLDLTTCSSVLRLPIFDLTLRNRTAVRNFGFVARYR